MNYNFLVIYLLGNNIHIHMKIYKLRIRFETYKNLKLKFAQNFIEMFLLQFQKQKLDSDRINSLEYIQVVA